MLCKLCGIVCTAQLQQMKCSVSKGDKKKKKDVAAQMAILEAELEARHEQELKALNEQDASKAVSWDHILLQYNMHYI